MDQPKQRFKINTRVRLRDGIDPVFFGGLSRVGNEGWIRKRKRDRYGYPEVLVEWDKEHWAYNGQPDCWTMEGQFEAAEESMTDKAPDSNDRDEQVRALTETFVHSLLGAIGNEEQSTPDPEEDVGEIDSDEWDELAAAAAEAVQKAPAYIVIALERLQVDDAPAMIVPRVFHAACDDDFKLIAQSHLAHVLASMQDETIVDLLQQASDNGEDQ